MIATAPIGPSMLSQLSADGAPAKKIPWTPSERDFEVYRQTAVEGRTTREVAAEFNLSQTRVVQLRDKVLEWIGRYLPPLAKLSPAERLRVAQTLACQQLQHQYDEAMQAWRKSATAVHVTRYVGRAIEDGLTVVKESQGDPRYLRLANQITKAIAKVGMMTMPDPETAEPIELLTLGNDETMQASGSRERPGGVKLDAAYVDEVGSVLNNQPSEQNSRSPVSRAPNHPEGDCSNAGSLAGQADVPTTNLETASSIRAALSDACSVSKAAPIESVEDVSQTVQAIVSHLENIPARQRRQLRREQQMRRELLGETSEDVNLLAQLTGKR